MKPAVRSFSSRQFRRTQGDIKEVPSLSRSCPGGPQIVDYCNYYSRALFMAGAETAPLDLS